MRKLDGLVTLSLGLAFALAAPHAASAATPSLDEIDRADLHPHVVSVEDGAFSSASVHVVPGMTVVWENEDDVSRTVRIEPRGAEAVAPPVTRAIAPGESWQYTVPQVGSYAYSTAGDDGVMEVIAAREPIEVEIVNFAYTPWQLELPAGTIVVFRQEDLPQHNVRFLTGELRNVASRYLRKGDVWMIALTYEGTFDYQCDPHPFMVGEITVTASQ